MSLNTLKSWYPGNGYEYEVEHIYVDGQYGSTKNTGRVRDATGQHMTFDVLMTRTMNEALAMKAAQETQALLQRVAA